ncbi:MAG TPA: Spy/CpxP family protein refolding chaperone [Stellaceae bacterium]|nr:Spy/CpxP family protein refolding chaperone [Stellaceae bacterium]
MKHTLLAAVLVAGTALTSAAFAQQPQNPAAQTSAPVPAANPPTQAPIGAAAAQPMPETQPGMGMSEGMMGMRERMHHMREEAEEHHHHWGEHHRMGWQHSREACINHLARRAAGIAYIGAKLDLNAQQRPLWDKIQNLVNDEAQRERQVCNSIKPPGSETALDRLARMEQMTATRLAGLKAVIPEVQQLYQTLTPAQRMLLDHPFRG